MITPGVFEFEYFDVLLGYCLETIGRKQSCHVIYSLTIAEEAWFTPASFTEGWISMKFWKQNRNSCWVGCTHKSISLSVCLKSLPSCKLHNSIKNGRPNYSTPGILCETLSGRMHQNSFIYPDTNPSAQVICRHQCSVSFWGKVTSLWDRGRPLGMK